MDGFVRPPFREILFRHLIMVPIAAGGGISALDWIGVCTESCAEASLYRLFGIPLPPLGVAYFTLCGIAFLLRRQHAFFRFALAVLLFGGLGSEIVFTWIQKYVIGQWCPMCVGIAICVSFACAIFLVEYFSGREERHFGKERKSWMKRLSTHAMLVLLALLIGVGISEFGLKKPDAFAAALTPDALAFGNGASSVEVYIVSDWFCPACRTAEPEILKGAGLAMKRAKVFFVDYPIHRETLNYIPYNLSFMVNEKGKYLQIREALAALSGKSKTPTAEEVQAAVSPLGVKCVPMDFADVVAGTQYQMSIVQKYRISGTPSVVVVESKTEKQKILVGSGEITSDHLLKAIEEISGK